jgi:hypothetical protein
MELLRDRYLLKRKVRHLESDLGKALQDNLELRILIERNSFKKEKELRDVIESYKKAYKEQS